jgi:hypothetical protein
MSKTAYTALTTEQLDRLAANPEVRDALADIAYYRIEMWEAENRLEGLLEREVETPHETLEGYSVGCDTREQILQELTPDTVRGILTELNYVPDSRRWYPNKPPKQPRKKSK